MIYFISDLHGGTRIQGLERYFSLYKEGDVLFILGDVGLKFEDTEENRKFTEDFLAIDKPIVIVEGNHENHAYLNSFPAENWNGGRINRISQHIIRLQRGNIFNIDGETFFVMGGCKSSPKWKEMGLWFDGEEPSYEESADEKRMREALGGERYVYGLPLNTGAYDEDALAPFFADFYTKAAARALSARSIARIGDVLDNIDNIADITAATVPCNLTFKLCRVD